MVIVKGDGKGRGKSAASGEERRRGGVQAVQGEGEPGPVDEARRSPSSRLPPCGGVPEAERGEESSSLPGGE